MDRAELIQFLRDNLRIDAEIKRGYYSDEWVKLTLKLDDSVISECTFDLPKCDKSSPYG